MAKQMSSEEVQSLERELLEAGAHERNARVCKCGHIDYFPNNNVMRNCVVRAQSCIECED